MWSYLLLWPLLDKGSDKSSSFISCWNCLSANLAHLFFNRTGFRRNAQKIAKAYSIIHAFTSLFSTGLNRKRNSAHSQTEVIHQCLFVFTVMYKLFTIVLWLWLVHKKQSCFCCLVCLFFIAFPRFLSLKNILQSTHVKTLPMRALVQPAGTKTKPILLSHTKYNTFSYIT